jgi:hypothetical protein
MESGGDMMGGVLEEEVLVTRSRDVVDDVAHDGGDDDDGGDNEADGADGVFSRHRRKTVLGAVAVLWSLFLVMGVCAGYLNAESLDKCGECIRSLSAPSTSFLQNDTFAEGVLTPAV